LRWFGNGPNFRPVRNIKYGEGENYLYDALDRTGYYRDAVGGPEWITLRQWLAEQPDKDQWGWSPSSPHESEPDWFDPIAPGAGAPSLLPGIPPLPRPDLAHYTSMNPEHIHDSLVHYGPIPPEALSE